MAEAKKDERTFHKRLMDAMAEMENPTKSKQAYKYKYETLEQVLGIIRPALLKHGLFLTQGFDWNEGAGCFVLETAVLDESGEDYMLDKRPMHQANDAQAEGSWETYMRRYALRTAFGLTGEDDDGEATKGAPKQSTASKRNTAALNDAFKGVKVTEMASDALMAKLNANIQRLAELKGKQPDEVRQALMDSKTMQGVKNYNAMTKDEAMGAFSVTVKWLDQAQPEDYAPEDIAF